MSVKELKGDIKYQKRVYTTAHHASYSTWFCVSAFSSFSYLTNRDCGFKRTRHVCHGAGIFSPRSPSRLPRHRREPVRSRYYFFLMLDAFVVSITMALPSPFTPVHQYTSTTPYKRVDLQISTCSRRRPGNCLQTRELGRVRVGLGGLGIFRGFMDGIRGIYVCGVWLILYPARSDARWWVLPCDAGRGRLWGLCLSAFVHYSRAQPWRDSKNGE